MLGLKPPAPAQGGHFVRHTPQPFARNREVSMLHLDVHYYALCGPIEPVCVQVTNTFSLVRLQPRILLNLNLLFH